MTLCSDKQTAFLLVDMQEKFRSVIPNFKDILAQCILLSRAVNILKLPTFVSEQYPEKLGATVQELQEVLPSYNPIAKTSFSCLGSTIYKHSLKELQAKHIIIAGIETHVCINQTVHDLLDLNYTVHVIADAVSSRSAYDKDIALAKMRASGAIISSTEMVIFEMLQSKDHPAFQDIRVLF